MTTAERKRQGYVAVVGLGTTGLACARYLRAAGRAVAVTDSRSSPPGLAALRAEQPDTVLSLGELDAALLRGAEEVVVSPGVALEEPAVQAARAAGVPVVGEIELFARAATAPVVAITGSNGKSTVTTLLGEMARAAGADAALGGNLGTPALELLREPEPALYVLELSSFQLESTTSLAPAAAVVLNLSADHMDRYPDLAAYAAAKQRVYQGAAVAVVNRDEPAVAAMAGAVDAQIGFTLGAPGADDYGLRQARGRSWLAHGEELLLPVEELRIAGRHNHANALAALALGEAVQLPPAAMLEALRRFPGLPHRTEWVAEAAGVRWFNDSKGTNVGATLAAIEGLPGPLVVILGGIGKGADFSPLAEPLARKARAVILLGRDAPLIEAALAADTPIRHAADMADAVAQARAVACAGDAVLLSPACASFDMYAGFEARGEDYRRRVQEVLA